MNEGARSINLLPQEQRLRREQQRRLRFIQWVFFALLVFLGIMAVVIWSVSASTTGQLVSLDRRITDLQQQISQISRQEQQFQLFANRLTMAAKILGTRFPLEHYLDEVINVFPEDISVRSVTVGQEKNVVEVVVLSNTHSGFSRLLDILGDGRFPLVKVNSVTRDAAGVYAVALNISVP